MTSRDATTASAGLRASFATPSTGGTPWRPDTASAWARPGSVTPPVRSLQKVRPGEVIPEYGETRTEPLEKAGHGLRRCPPRALISFASAVCGDTGGDESLPATAPAAVPVASAGAASSCDTRAEGAGRSLGEPRAGRLTEG